MKIIAYEREREREREREKEGERVDSFLKYFEKPKLKKLLSYFIITLLHINNNFNKREHNEYHAESIF